MTRSPAAKAILSDAQLLTFIDGQADPELAQLIGDRLSTDPALQARLAGLDAGVTQLQQAMGDLLATAPKADLAGAYASALQADTLRRATDAASASNHWTLPDIAVQALALAAAFAVGFLVGTQHPTEFAQPKSDTPALSEQRSPPVPEPPLTPYRTAPVAPSPAEIPVAAAPTPDSTPISAETPVATPPDNAPTPAEVPLAAAPAPDTTPSPGEIKVAAAPAPAADPNPAEVSRPAVPAPDTAPTRAETPVTAVAAPATEPSQATPPPALPTPLPVEPADPATELASRGQPSPSDVSETAKPEPWVAAVASYVRLMTAETLEQTGQTPIRLRARLMAMSKRFDVDLTAIVRQVPELKLRRIEVLQFNGRPLLQLGFLDRNQVPVAVCIIMRAKGATATATAEAGQTSFLRETSFGLAAVHWNRQPLGLLVIGSSSAERLGDVANRINNAL